MISRLKKLLCKILGCNFPAVVIVGAAGPAAVQVPIKTQCPRCRAEKSELVTLPPAPKPPAILAPTREGWRGHMQ